MRITAGHARGRVFKTPEGNGTRPTDARTRETLFNIIGERVVKARVLDLYAGSGALGFEALSRGAQSVLFIEQNPAACRVIRDNIKSLGYEDVASVWQTNIKSAIARLLEKSGQQSVVSDQTSDDETRHLSLVALHFDLVLADPPFHRKAELPQLCALLDNIAPLLHNGKEPFSPLPPLELPPLLVIQHAWKDEPHLSPIFHRINQRRAGESRLSFYHINSPKTLETSTREPQPREEARP